MIFVANFICFPPVQKFWTPVKIWQSYIEFKGRTFFETQCIFIRQCSNSFNITQLTVMPTIIIRTTQVAKFIFKNRNDYSLAKLTRNMTMRHKQIIYPAQVSYKTWMTEQNIITCSTIKRPMPAALATHKQRTAVSASSTENILTIISIRLVSLLASYRSSGWVPLEVNFCLKISAMWWSSVTPWVSRKGLLRVFADQVLLKEFVSLELSCFNKSSLNWSSSLRMVIDRTEAQPPKQIWRNDSVPAFCLWWTMFTGASFRLRDFTGTAFCRVLAPLRTQGRDDDEAHNDNNDACNNREDDSSDWQS